MRRLMVFVIPFLTLVVFAPAVAAQDASPMAGGTPTASLLAGLGYPELVVTTDGTTNDLPSTLTAGRYHLVLHDTNTTNPVAIDFYQTPAGTSEADAIAFYPEAVSSQGVLPDLFYTLTLPGGVSAPPNGMGDAIIDLAPGDWYAGIQIESTDNGPGTGAAQPLSVTGTMPTLSDPAAAVTASLSDFKIDIPDSVSTGPQIWKVTNAGAVPHLLALGMSDGSLTPENVQQTFGLINGTPLPADATPLAADAIEGLGATEGLSSGQSMWIEVDLPQAGQYLAVCFVTGPDDLPEHAAMGMIKIFNAA